MFYEYPSEFEEDIENTEPPYGPSSPPFEEASAPHFAFEALSAGDLMISASAPPLEEDDLFPYTGDINQPSAPPMDEDELVSGDRAGSPSAPGGAEPGLSTTSRGERRNVTGDANPGATAPRQRPRYGDEPSPPQYLP